MIAVIFEFRADPAQRTTYLELARRMSRFVEDADGFLGIERFQSLEDEHRVLSLSFWRDEEAVTAWRNTVAHREAQARGRAGIFRDYRLRVAHVVRDYGLDDRAQAPADSRAAHD